MADPALADAITTYGGGGALAVLLVERAIHFLRGGVGKGLAAMKAQTASLDELTRQLNGTTSNVEAIRVQQQSMQHDLSDLHEQHAVTDADGVPVWYVRRSMEDALDTVTTNLQQVSHVLERLVDRVEQISRS
tara:strand:- start:1217 stop:1615 length:399 start_codon:yes stop_codon:yes gene_type:complete